MPTTTVPDAEVEGSAGLRRDAEIHSAVIPSLISINRPQHLHHLKHRDRESRGDWVRRGCVNMCVFEVMGEEEKKKVMGETLRERVLLATNH